MRCDPPGNNSMPKPKFYFVHETVRYTPRKNFTSEVLPGVWEEAALLDRIGRDRLDELVRYPTIIEVIGDA